jgi:hypothetical protein
MSKGDASGSCARVREDGRESRSSRSRRVCSGASGEREMVEGQLGVLVMVKLGSGGGSEIGDVEREEFR